VEQILLNLIDNACKYAVTAIDRRILIQGSLAKGTVELRVRDFGPGFPASRWWRPFRKSVEQAAESAPGIGLGLSLSRRLAKQFGGRLRHEKSAQGACLVLSLPLATG
jgi:K+-sensing histidine kinase KdpD